MRVHLFPGFSGLATGVGILAIVWASSYLTKKDVTYNLEPEGKVGAFEPFVAKYIRAAEYIIGLATGSIVLLVGSSALHGQGGRLPWFYASPLLLLALSVVYGIAFMVWLIWHYEMHQHGNPHTRGAYSLTEGLGFGSLSCFCVGYIWLIIQVTH
jgi:hypothetical protein